MDCGVAVNTVVFRATGGITRRHVRTDKVIILIFASLLLPTGNSSANGKENTSPEALISRALLQQDVWTDGAKPMLMRAAIQVTNAKDASVKGNYVLNRVSASQWREEIRFADYDRLRVGNAKGYWQKSALSYQPELIFQLDTMLHLKDALRIGATQHLGKVRTREKNGVRCECTEVKWTTATDREMCFDQDSGALVSVEYPRDSFPREISRTEYDAFKKLDEKFVPYEIRALRDGKIVASVTILEIEKTTERDPTLFEAPVDAELWEHCDDMQQAVVATQAIPRYPQSARDNHVQGEVILYGVVETDGSVSHITVIQQAAPELVSAAVEAVRQWRYKPAFCGQRPVRVEISIPVRFTLG